MKIPNSRKEVQHFIGVVNNHRNIWPRWSHTLAPLTRIKFNKRTFKWTKTEQDYFDEIKQILDHDTLLTYPDFNETFKTHINASKFHLGAAISQKGEPIAFYSRKRNVTQKGYKVTYIELLSIVKTPKEFRTIFLGQKLIIYTDH